MTRKLAILIGLAAAVALPAVAQEHQHGQRRGMNHRAGAMDTPWRELNGFHSLLHLSHHPLMESGDLAPARQNAARLADAAEQWAASTPPAECNLPADSEETVSKLATDARAYAALVEAAAGDDEVKAALNRLHDGFRKLHRACMPGGRHHERGEPHR